ncbi:MAG TPA: saccharopine dehydrogenase NADP-binding domain-containing protein [Segetibacter sp.]
MSNNQFLLYGANGYSGELTARYAAEYQVLPILAGRREAALSLLAAKYNYPYKTFDVNNTPALEDALSNVKLVVNAAGPFDFTAKQIINACLKTRTHYIDINGDMAVFEMLQSYDAAAKEAGIMIMSGVGFDVVPTDCLALFLKKLLPDAVSLKLAFAMPGGGLSHGTATTTVLKLGEPGAERKNGKIVPVPLGEKGMWVNFTNHTTKRSEKMFVMSLPWGDVFTAFLSTGIPNITSYTHVPPLVFRLLKLQRFFNPLLKKPFTRKLVQKIIDSRPPGLNDAKREKSVSLVWGEVINSAGKKATATLTAPDAYTLTAYTTLLIANKILAGIFQPGYQTPAAVYGEDLIMEISGVKREQILSS